MKKSMDLQPCGWAKGDLYLAYHQDEWGIACRDDKKLFEKLCLEGQQAGLSWITVLKKRAHYRQRFHRFNPTKVAAMSDAELEDCLLDAGLIRNRLKIYAIRSNAQAYLAMKKSGVRFADFVWSFVGNQVVVNHFSELSQLPAATEQSLAMSRGLKKLGFKFIGPTICYAFMQSMGLVNDHLVNCPQHPRNINV
ncbi:MAG: DNA-3-methyladenine glycosylase I [Bermanella sp.]